MSISGGGLAGPPARAGGAQESDAIRVDLDRDGRVRTVQLTALPDALRDGDTLDRAFRAAMAHALAAGLPAAPPTLDASGRVRAARVTLPERRPLRDLVQEAMDRQPVASSDTVVRSFGGEQGESDNGCVTVVLDPAGPGGDLTFDAGWLRQTTPTNLAAAITQAFAAAYRERGTR
jgi:hypothetical protein